MIRVRIEKKAWLMLPSEIVDEIVSIKCDYDEIIWLMLTNNSSKIWYNLVNVGKIW